MSHGLRILSAMGSASSKDPSTIDTTGNINNNVIISDTVNVHSDHMATALYIIAGIKIIELLYLCFRIYNKNNKKKYIQQGLSLNKI